MGCLGVIVGAVIGLWITDGGFWGFVIGAVAGHFIVKRFSSDSQSRTSKKGKLGLPPDFPASEKTVILLFRCFGKFAKEDGRVTENEAEIIKAQMNEWHFSKATQKKLRLEFNAGRDSKQSFEELFSEFYSSLNSNSYPLPGAIACFAILAWADGLTPRKRKLLNLIGRSFNMMDYLNSIIQELEKTDEEEEQEEEQNSYKEEEEEERKNYSVPPKNSLEKYYEILGIPANSTNAEVKSAWRKKARDFHPDRVRGAGLSEEFVRYANEQLQKINEAYEKISKARGI